MIIAHSPLGMAVGIVIAVVLFAMGCYCAATIPQWIDEHIIFRNTEDDVYGSTNTDSQTWDQYGDEETEDTQKRKRDR